MLQKKICMLGGFAVGKTSLVRRFVQSIFSDTYLTTVGVKIDKKSVAFPDKTVDLILWDLAGEDDIGSFRVSYVRGAAGLVLVVDGTRPATLAVALTLRERAEAEFGTMPFVLLFNKSDLADRWAISDGEIDELKQRGWQIYLTSALSGDHVDDAFRQLASMVAK
ncbi:MULTISPECIES: Rab family GTPase [unclassified Mesorhizobium]|uniref:Rab family GTPase n=1 Tax=unclassified Mesorhizobium TaxID=325217 RepID=UPI000FC9D47B|nr:MULTISPECIES: Rab family GTPase [unclassified Mesorhizobium]TIT78187.1 MAG: GTP-binding protein [Mesorhizobium sp.]TGP23663.1 GTP-binding protein [Mesorhizobium sp. M1D.F.Ca.ET.231.01.1.1]TGP33807.1 GTP-binding protein [Mesorhizobium sp. M1D.F.Ca.ET.234.01.1.1]TGS47173.1 GTP-binding protein [Mesorhizobium sp. M1D.F.Ca.ET.184.01.1.1]TGS62431.1 GTP-binding protein [Mesorhizobium sp. M1D.F.Ca.ET.183.01.1.1]